MKFSKFVYLSKKDKNNFSKNISDAKIISMKCLYNSKSIMFNLFLIISLYFFKKISS